MNQVIDRRVVFASAANFRDLGGLPIADGEVKRGEIYRSATLARLSDDDLPSFESLGINTVFDLRTAAESSADPDRLPQGARYLPLDVLADGTAGVAHAVAQLRHNPESVNDLLAGSRVDDMLMQSYREFITIASAQNAYRAFFEEVASAGREGAALFHCTAGKDRTGWAAAALLMLLGADEATIRADYLQTNDDYLPTLEPLFASARDRGVDPELLRTAFSVKNEYLDTAMNQLETSFGTVERYFTEGLGLAPATIDALRARLTA